MNALLSLLFARHFGYFDYAVLLVGLQIIETRPLTGLVVMLVGVVVSVIGEMALAHARGGKNDSQGR